MIYLKIGVGNFTLKTIILNTCMNKYYIFCERILKNEI